jgi:hypothetical protein
MREGGLLRTTPVLMRDGRTQYRTERFDPTSGQWKLDALLRYTGEPVVTSPEQTLGKLYRWVTELGERLLKWVEAVEGGPSAPRERPDSIEAPVETTRNFVLTLILAAKVGHVLALAAWAGTYVAYLRIKHLVGFH